VKRIANGVEGGYSVFFLFGKHKPLTKDQLNAGRGCKLRH
jgi:hypothetical protein